MKTSHIKGEFLASIAGRIFSLAYIPETESQSAVVIIPSFGEEMNKSRRSYSLLAKYLAKSGYFVLIPDLFGTGDSEGDFSESSWDIWQNDIDTCVQHLSTLGIKYISFIAHRTGALLVCDYLSSRELSLSCLKLILWQPVVDGSTFLNQFLRIRLVSSMMKNGKDKETTKDLMAQLENGTSLEIAGYTLSSKLAIDLRSSSLRNFSYSRCVNAVLIDLVTSLERNTPMTSQKLVDSWAQKGLSLSLQVAVGESFWSSVEIVESRDLIEKTVAIFQDGECE